MPPIIIPDLPDNWQVPGVYAGLDFTRAIKGILGIQNKALAFCQRMPAFITPARWQGGTLHDMTLEGTYTGTSVLNVVIEIDAAGTPDTFKASFDGGVTFPVTTEDIVAGPIALTGSDGLTVTFAATTGHAVGDKWTGEAFPEPSVAKEVITQTTRGDDGHNLAGFGSMAGRMIKAAYLQNPIVNLSFLLLDDTGSNFSAGSIDFTTALAAGSMTVWIANERHQVAVAKDDTPESTAIAMQNEIAKNTKLMVTVAVNSANPSLIDIVAKNSGTVGNLIRFRTDSGSTGIVPVIVNMTGGSTDPTITAAITALAQADHYYWAYPYKDSTSVNLLKDDIDDRSGIQKMRPAMMFVNENLDFNDAITLSAAVNTGRGQNFAIEGILEYPPETISKAISALTLSASSIQNYQNTVFKGTDVPEFTDRFTPTEQQLMILGGVTPLITKNNSDLLIQIGRSMYLKDSQGNDDTSQKSINTTRTGDLVRSDVVNFIDSSYGQAKTDAADDIEKDIVQRMLLFETRGILKNVLENQDLISSAINISNDQRLDFEVPLAVIPDLTIIGINFLVNAA